MIIKNCKRIGGGGEQALLGGLSIPEAMFDAKFNGIEWTGLCFKEK